MKERLFGVGLVGLIVLFVVGRAATNYKPSIVDIVGQSELEATIETDPVAHLEQKLDDRTASLDELYARVEQKLDESTKSLREACDDNRLMNSSLAKKILDLYGRQDEIKGVIDKVVEVQEQMLNTHKAMLGTLKQSDAPPAKTQLAKELTFIYGDGCQPCDQWKISPDREQIAAECHIVPVFVGDLPPEARPESLPAYTLQVDGLRARHRGFLTFQRFKDMERAILEKRRSQ